MLSFILLSMIFCDQFWAPTHSALAALTLQVLERGQVASHWAALHWAAFNVTQNPAGSSKTTKTSWIHQGIISVAFFGASGLWIQE